MKIETLIETNKRIDGIAKVSLTIKDETDVKIELDFRHLLQLIENCGRLNQTTLDFLLFSAICYTVDKYMSRSKSHDNWTREIEVTIPVHEPEKWVSAIAEITKAMDFLTGDSWIFHFTNTALIWYKQPSSIIPKTGFNNVCLFSGGLDSLVGAIDLIATTPPAKNLLLIGHYDGGGPKSQQIELYPAIQQKYKDSIVKLVQIRVSATPSEICENTLRSRSIVFIALGLCAANALSGQMPLHIPENGFIAINLPLTPSRVGSCSTRTMHPIYIAMLSNFLNKIGIRNPLINPLAFKTKGEAVFECRDLELLKKIVQESVSCSHFNRRMNWIRTADVKNCGYCVPCIIRRSALHTIGIDNGLNYGLDIFRNEIGPKSEKLCADDSRAVFDAIKTQYSVPDIKKILLNIGTIENVEEYSKMLFRGFEEIRKWIKDNDEKRTKHEVGIPS